MALSAGSDSGIGSGTPSRHERGGVVRSGGDA